MDLGYAIERPLLSNVGQARSSLTFAVQLEKVGLRLCRLQDPTRKHTSSTGFDAEMCRQGSWVNILG